MAKRGRPTKYAPGMIKIADDYLNECIKDKKIPFLEELALKMGISGDSLLRYKANTEFCGAIDRIKDYQCLYLIKSGLRANPAQMAIFLLKTVHGLRVPKVGKYSSDNEKPLLIAFK